MEDSDGKRTQQIKTHLLESAAVKQQIAETCADAVLSAARVVAGAFRNGGKLLLCGNGGSAADCQHLAAEFVNRLTAAVERPALAALALTTDTSFLTSFSNDYSYEKIFSRQVEAFGKAGDVLLGISTSGNSANVIAAMQTAQARNMHTIALIGAGGRLVSLAQIVISIPSRNTQYIQESHLAIEHILCELVEDDLFVHKPAPGE
jgi:D-sedoheptulose 7-phosphate isomerase